MVYQVLGGGGFFPKHFLKRVVMNHELTGKKGSLGGNVQYLKKNAERENRLLLNKTVRERGNTGDNEIDEVM